MASGLLSVSEKEGPIQAGDRDRDQFDGEQHAAHDGLGFGRREDEVHAEKFRCTSRRSFPGRKHDGEDQYGNHPIQHIEVELLRRRGAWSDSWVSVWSGSQPLPTVRAKAIDLRQRPMAGRTGLHEV